MQRIMGRLFRIAGVPGCGKTTVTMSLRKLAGENGAVFHYINSKHILCELTNTPDEAAYRCLPELERRALFPQLIRRITDLADANPSRVWYFERHLCSMHEDGHIIARSIPDEHGPRTLGQAVIIADPREIARWRIKDQNVRHDRHQLSLNQIEIEQEREKQLALDAGTHWGFQTRLFLNQSGQSADLAAEIFEFMKSLIPSDGAY